MIHSLTDRNRLTLVSVSSRIPTECGAVRHVASFSPQLAAKGRTTAAAYNINKIK